MLGDDDEWSLPSPFIWLHGVSDPFFAAISEGACAAVLLIVTSMVVMWVLWCSIDFGMPRASFSLTQDSLLPCGKYMSAFRALYFQPEGALSFASISLMGLSSLG